MVTKERNTSVLLNTEMHSINTENSKMKSEAILPLKALCAQSLLSAEFLPYEQGQKL